MSQTTQIGRLEAYVATLEPGTHLTAARIACELDIARTSASMALRRLSLRSYHLVRLPRQRNLPVIYETV